MATIGKTEDIGYEAGVARFRETSRGHIMGLDTGLLKMMFALDDRRLLGVHIVGEGATELIHIDQAVLNVKGALDNWSKTPSTARPWPKPTRSRPSMPGTAWG